MFLLLPSTAFAVTKTICTSGCDYTSFASAFSSYDFAPGDILEAQADTPGGSRTFVETVTPGADDEGDSNNQFIIRGRSGDTIKIDGGTRAIDGDANNNEYITYDNFNFDGDSASEYCVVLGTTGGSNDPSSAIINGNIIQNSIWMDTICSQNIYITGCVNCQSLNNSITTADGSYSTTDGIGIYRSSGTIIDSNYVEGRNDNPGPHSDCLQSAFDENLTIRNSEFYQNNTRNNNVQIVYPQAGGYMRIYNNIIRGNGYSGVLKLRHCDPSPSNCPTEVQIYNNTIDATTETGTLAYGGIALGDHASKPTTLNIQNNIIKISINGNYPIFLENNGYTTTGIHHNILWDGSSGGDLVKDGTSSYTLSQWQAKTAGDNEGWGSIEAVPDWDANYQATSSSDNFVDVGYATDADDLFTDDKDGTGRPQGAAWDMGAYEFTGTFPPQNTPVGSPSFGGFGGF
jgi:hypothetical protein